MKKIFALIVLTGFLGISCQKDSDKVTEQGSYNPLTLSDYGDVNGLITILAQMPYQVSNPSSAPVSYSLEGRIQDMLFGSNGAQNLDAGNLTIDGDVMAKTSDYIYRNNTLTDGADYFGDSTTFSISGNQANNIESTTVSFYVPEKITLSSPSSLTLTQSGNNVFTWAPDNSYSGKVYIKVTYKATMSRDRDSTLPSEYVVFEDEVDDNIGSYTLGSTVLSTMPVGGIIDVTLGRGNYALVNTGSHNVLIAVGAITYNDFLLEE